MKINELIKVENTSRGSFLEGFISVFKSFDAVKKNKSTIKYFVIPFILNIFILSAVFYLSYSFIHPYLSGFLQGDEWYISAVRFILTPVLLILLLLITALFYSVVGNIITAPFNDFLSESLERKITGVVNEEKFSFALVFGDISRMFGNVIKMLGLLVFVNIIFLVLNFIPVAGSIIYSVLGYLSTTFFFGFQFFDFPLERRRFNFNAKLKIAWYYRWATMGVGTAFFLLSFIPLVGFLALNFGTMGATLFFIKNIKPGLE